MILSLSIRGAIVVMCRFAAKAGTSMPKQICSSSEVCGISKGACAVSARSGSQSRVWLPPAPLPPPPQSSLAARAGWPALIQA